MKYENPAKAKYVNREPIINGMVRFANPTLAAIIAKAGAETITIDNEHYPFTDDDIINICRAIHANGAECTVRLGTKNLNAMYRVMDMGVDGLLLPNVETAEEAQMIVDAIKYPPEGRRGCCPITRAADYGVNLDVKEYYEKINTVTTVGIMIESKKGYENLDEILKVKGIDYMVIGPSDFSGSFGKPGQAATDPEIKAAMKDAYERMYAAGVSTGGLAYFPEQTLEALKTNKTYLNAGSDLQILTRSFKAHIDGARKAIKDAGLECEITDPVEKLRRGYPVLAPFIRIAEPGIAEIIAMSGADFMIVDDEHFPFTDKEIISVIRAGHGKGCKVLVRPHDKSKAAIGRILDMGADGIVAPQVLNAEEAEAIVKAVKYGPEGNRGLCPITAGADYGFGHSAQDYAIQANKKTVVGIMIETKSAVEDIDRILAIPGIDFITFGPSDLSNSYGVPGQYDSDLIKGVIRTIREKTRNAGIALNSIAYSDEAVAEELKDGATVLNIGSDVQYMIWGWTKLISDTKKVIEEFKR